MTKIKIAHILHCVGGVDVYLRLILSSIDSNNFSNIIIHGTDDTNKIFRNNKNETVTEYKTNIIRKISLINDFKAVYSIYKVLKNEKPNLIHCHSAKGGIIGRLLGRMLGIDVLYTPHAFSYLSAGTKFQKNIYLGIERIFANGNSALLATSVSEKNNGIEKIKYHKNKSLLFTNSINSIDSINDLTIKKTWPEEYICTVGRPSYQKNIELMIKVMYELQKTKKIHLVIMGVGPVSDQLESVKKLIKKLELSNAVTLIDWTDRENIFHIISKSKLYLSTARYEGLPYSVIESLALSKPCVVSHCDGNIDLIEDAYNGFVIEGKNVTEYTEKINLLLNNEELLKDMSYNAKKSFDENYNIVNNISVLEKVYKEYAVK